jgi:hypothetical protein
MDAPFNYSETKRLEEAEIKAKYKVIYLEKKF